MTMSASDRFTQTLAYYTGRNSGGPTRCSTFVMPWNKGKKRLAERPRRSGLCALASTLLDLAQALAANQQLAEAEQHLRRAIPIFDRLARDYPKTLLYRQELAFAQMKHADQLKQLGQTPEAEKVYWRAVDLYEKLAADFPWIPKFRQSAFDQSITLSRFLAQGGRPLEAQEVLGKATMVSQKLPDDSAGRLVHKQRLVRSHLAPARPFEGGRQDP